MTKFDYIANINFITGPRNCIGMRFALLMMKISLVKIVSKFKIVKGPKTPEYITHDPVTPFATVQGGTWVKIIPRD